MKASLTRPIESRPRCREHATARKPSSRYVTTTCSLSVSGCRTSPILYASGGSTPHLGRSRSDPPTKGFFVTLYPNLVMPTRGEHGPSRDLLAGDTRQNPYPAMRELSPGCAVEYGFFLLPSRARKTLRAGVRGGPHRHRSGAARTQLTGLATAFLRAVLGRAALRAQQPGRYRPRHTAEPPSRSVGGESPLAKD